MGDGQQFQIGGTVVYRDIEFVIMGVLKRAGTGDDGYRYCITADEIWNEGRAQWVAERDLSPAEDDTE